MFGAVLKIVRALLGALALMLVVGGGRTVAADASTGADEATWRDGKCAETAAMALARAEAACPVARAAQAAGMCGADFPTIAVFLAPLVKSLREVAVPAGARREPEREPRARTRPGEMRLRI